ncbi:MAG: hypothetical protein ACRCY7_05010 [Cetobacterium sp.]
MKIDELNEKIERNREKLQKMQKGARIKSYENNKEKRRKRARNLIMLGALFEIENLHRENASTLLGFIHENKDLFFKNRDRYFEIGGELLEARKNLKTGEIKEVGEGEIKELLELVSIFKSKNKDLGVFIQEKFKKKLFKDLTVNEFKIIKDYIKNL